MAAQNQQLIKQIEAEFRKTGNQRRCLILMQHIESNLIMQGTSELIMLEDNTLPTPAPPSSELEANTLPTPAPLGHPWILDVDMSYELRAALAIMTAETLEAIGDAESLIVDFVEGLYPKLQKAVTKLPCGVFHCDRVHSTLHFAEAERIPKQKLARLMELDKALGDPSQHVVAGHHGQVAFEREYQAHLQEQRRLYSFFAEGGLTPEVCPPVLTAVRLRMQDVAKCFWDPMAAGEQVKAALDAARSAAAPPTFRSRVAGAGWNVADSNFLAVAGCAHLGVAPADAPAWRCELTPVDFAARAVAALAGDRGAVGKAFNLVNARTLPMAAVFDAVRSCGVALRSVPYAGRCRR